MNTALVTGAAVVAIALAALVYYNSLVRARTMVDEGWSGVDVQLRRRQDLVPNLVSTVKGYAAHEVQTLEAVTGARSAAVAADDPDEATQAENSLAAALGKLLAVAEAYPDLKASDNFLKLQAELADTENEIAAARAIYNGNVRIFNSKVQSFPGMLVAKPFGFTARAFFQAEATERVAASVTI
ncbi:MAG: LemA family protein [Thermoleophilaceae bacterium]|nr:LemA family protein [Thermoleophilaceae bacterium]